MPGQMRQLATMMVVCVVPQDQLEVHPAIGIPFKRPADYLSTCVRVFAGWNMGGGLLGVVFTPHEVATP